MDQEQIDQEQADNDFNAGFNAVHSSDDYSPPEDKALEAEPNAPEPDAVVETPEPLAEEPLFAGMTESQIKSLLERSARVDGIEDQLRKAHGKIGELNGSLQELKSHQKPPTQNAPAVNENEMTEFERDYPEFVAVVESRARRIAAEMMSNHPTNEAPTEDIRTQLQQETQLGIMDAMYPDWRDTVGTQDFALWIATQPAETQQTYNNTWNARELSGIVSGFKASQQTAAARTSSSKQRLEAALIPTGNAGKVTHSPSAEDEFLAGFNSVGGQLYR